MLSNNDGRIDYRVTLPSLSPRMERNNPAKDHDQEQYERDLLRMTLDYQNEPSLQQRSSQKISSFTKRPTPNIICKKKIKSEKAFDEPKRSYVFSTTTGYTGKEHRLDGTVVNDLIDEAVSLIGSESTCECINTASDIVDEDDFDTEYESNVLNQGDFENLRCVSNQSTSDDEEDDTSGGSSQSNDYAEYEDQSQHDDKGCFTMASPLSSRFSPSFQKRRGAVGYSTLLMASAKMAQMQLDDEGSNNTDHADDTETNHHYECESMITPSRFSASLSMPQLFGYAESCNSPSSQNLKRRCDEDLRLNTRRTQSYTMRVPNSTSTTGTTKASSEETWVDTLFSPGHLKSPTQIPIRIDSDKCKDENCDCTIPKRFRAECYHES